MTLSIKESVIAWVHLVPKGLRFCLFLGVVMVEGFFYKAQS